VEVCPKRYELAGQQPRPRLSGRRRAFVAGAVRTDDVPDRCGRRRVLPRRKRYRNGAATQRADVLYRKVKSAWERPRACGQFAPDPRESAGLVRSPTSPVETYRSRRLTLKVHVTLYACNHARRSMSGGCAIWWGRGLTDLVEWPERAAAEVARPPAQPIWN